MLIRNIMLGVCAILVSFQAVARNDVLSLDLEAALNTPAAQQKLNQGVSFYFGENSHPKVLKKVGDVKTSKKTNAFNKSDTEACQWVFLSAMLELQASALRQGGNAVVDIKSNYENNLVSSNTQFNCGSGFLMAGVALTGKVVKLDD